MPSGSCALRAQDKGTAPHAGDGPLPGGWDAKALSPRPTVPYEIYRPDHSCLITVLPVNASVRDVLRSLAPRLARDREHILVKVNSAGGERGLPEVPPCRGASRPVPSQHVTPSPWRR